MMLKVFIVGAIVALASANRYAPADTPRYNPPPANPPASYNPPPPRYNPPADTPKYNPPADTPRYNPPADTPKYNPPPANPPSYNPPADTPKYNAPPANPPSYNPPADTPKYNAPPANPPSYNPPADSYAPASPPKSYVPAPYNPKPAYSPANPYYKAPTQPCCTLLAAAVKELKEKVDKTESKRYRLRRRIKSLHRLERRLRKNQWREEKIFLELLEDKNGRNSGTDGEKGQKGDTGATGNTGAFGAQGLPGLPGDPGADHTGAKGAPGNNGTPGTKGAHGTKGEKGSSYAEPGPKGYQGMEGPPGPPGPPGTPGIRGVEGPEGPKGNRGHNGEDTSCLDRGCPGVQCTAPWVLNGDRTHCYVLSTKIGGAAGNYAKAKADCIAAGSSLASITNVADNALATSLLTNDGVRTAWIGLNDIAVENTFVWEDATTFMLGSALYYQNWYKNKNGAAPGTPEPNNGGVVASTENCVRLYGMIRAVGDNGPDAMFPAVPGVWGDELCTGGTADTVVAGVVTVAGTKYEIPGVCKKLATNMT